HIHTVCIFFFQAEDGIRGRNVTGVQTCALPIFILLLFKNSIINLFNLNEIGDFLFLIPLVVLFAGFMQVMEQWLIRTKQFSLNARVTLFQSLITNLGKVVIVLFYPLATVLVVITAFANGIKGTFMFLLNKDSILIQDSKVQHDRKQMKELATQYYDFPLYRAPEQFLNAASNSLPILMLTAFFGPASAG